MSETLKLRTGSPEETRELGRFIAGLLGPGGYISLYGNLGAGKTTFVQGLADGLGVGDLYITSPTFSLVNVHRGRLTLYHIDLYRLSGPDDLEDIGFSEFPGDGVAAVEWPERAGRELPDDRLEVHIEHAEENGRMITLRALGARYALLLEEVCRSPQWSGRLV